MRERWTNCFLSWGLVATDRHGAHGGLWCQCPASGLHHDWWPRRLTVPANDVVSSKRQATINLRGHQSWCKPEAGHWHHNPPCAPWRSVATRPQLRQQFVHRSRLYCLSCAVTAQDDLLSDDGDQALAGSWILLRS
ncbi:hypothetical protein C7M84_004051 [Penaeus vannamei]|uniref:Uncharacterized protein n=1 Tax=Penaeus vannamei TaxID=6689 RepID=A0A3R7P745_PENVA|nr:hypothetical protein C7M84_004051 [Penaeus vannamei]